MPETGCNSFCAGDLGGTWSYQRNRPIEELPSDAVSATTVTGHGQDTSSYSSTSSAPTVARRRSKSPYTDGRGQARTACALNAEWRRTRARHMRVSTLPGSRSRYIPRSHADAGSAARLAGCRGRVPAPDWPPALGGDRLPAHHRTQEEEGAVVQKFCAVTKTQVGAVA